MRLIILRSIQCRVSSAIIVVCIKDLCDAIAIIIITFCSMRKEVFALILDL